jgi:glutathione S-transferase
MQLAYSSSSPWVRRVAVTVTELGLDDGVERIAVDNSSFDSDYVRINPLMKVPALILDDGEVLIDSFAIAEYLGSLQNRPVLFPPAGEARRRHLQILVLINGIQESATQITGERVRRPEALRWPDFIDKLTFKIVHGLDRLEQQADALEGRVSYITIAAGVLLGFLDFRLPDLIDWRKAHPRLASFYAEFSARPSMTGSEYRLRQ